MKFDLNATEILEIPENISPAYGSLEEYRISCALQRLSDLEIGELVRTRTMPPNTPIFRGTDRGRFEKIIGELWWTVNLRKAANYASKNKSPIILIGDFGSLLAFKDVQYLDDAVYIASQELYRGNSFVTPQFKIISGKICSIMTLESVR